MDFMNELFKWYMIGRFLRKLSDQFKSRHRSDDTPVNDIFVECEVIEHDK